MWEYPQLRVEVDVNDAIRIEEALTAETFPKKAMAIIVYSYVYPWLNFSGAMRKINRFPGEYVKQSNFDAKLLWSKQVLHNRLMHTT
jgi:muconolactone delta-isomerase